MIETIKKTLFAGLGAAAITKDAVESALHDWIEKGKITPEEARHFAEKLVNTGEHRWEKTKDEVSQKVSELAGKVPFVKRGDLQALEARVAVLEQMALRAQLAGDATPRQPSTEGELLP
ncbi:MAG: hypothetical protein LBD14_00330 [Puniceicoccales bacterium]|jgi:polyhydroxyalkanoate synthesis regulator phasin|nr:hypothetical protein [Puniceicoccales bacterium]